MLLFNYNPLIFNKTFSLKCSVIVVINSRRALNKPLNPKMTSQFSSSNGHPTQ